MGFFTHNEQEELKQWCLTLKFFSIRWKVKV